MGPPESRTFSVALCTFNGERYLREMLQSLSAQTRLPDELIVCDDHSVDGSVLILQEYARSAPFPVQIVVNDRNIGVIRNFEQAIRLCKSKIIALADQDDVWHSGKLAAFDSVFAFKADAHIVFANAEVVDENLQPLGYTVWSAAGFSSTELAEVSTGQGLHVLLRHNVVQGAAMAFLADIRQYILPLDSDVIHDAWIALLGAATGTIHAIPKTLVLYRQHGGNQIGSRMHSLFERMRGSCSQSVVAARTEQQRYERALERIRELRCVRVPPEVLVDLTGKVDHLKQRISVTMREKGWLRLAWVEARRGRYHRYSSGVLSVVRDLVKCPFRRNLLDRDT